MKYAALVLNSLAVFLLGWGLYSMFQLAQVRAPAIRPMMSEMNPLPMSLRKDQAMVADALEAMVRIQTQARRTGTDALSLVALPVPGSDVEGSLQMPRRSMSLYLDIPATRRQAAVIDGNLVKPGMQLSDGGRVTRLHSNEAVVRERLGQQTLALPEASLRIGTLRWPDGTLASTYTQKFRPGIQGHTAPAGSPP